MFNQGFSSSGEKPVGFIVTWSLSSGRPAALLASIIDALFKAPCNKVAKHLQNAENYWEVDQRVLETSVYILGKAKIIRIGHSHLFGANCSDAELIRLTRHKVFLFEGTENYQAIVSPGWLIVENANKLSIIVH